MLNRREICTFLAVATLGCAARAHTRAGKSSNSVVEHFHDSELQCETDDQLKVIRATLSDLLNLPVAELRAKKYPDYQMQPGQWDVAMVIDRYFVSASGLPVARESFFKDLRTREARAEIQRQLETIRDYRGAGP